MHNEITFDFTVLHGFMVALSRVSGFVLLVPIPGFNAAPAGARILLALALTVCLAPFWPAVSANPLFADLIIWVAAEFAFGLVCGLAIAFLLEAFQVAAQAVGLQAGFSYASTIDPSTQADTAVLQTVLQLFAGVLFFAMGLHLELLRVLTIRLDVLPTGAALAQAFQPEAVMRFGTIMFTTGLRLAMPILGSLLLLDLAFALLSKVHAQMQLLSFSFSAKMLAALALFAVTFSLCPTLAARAADRTFEVLLPLLK